jgi:ABC-type phosphate transport system substrate-binding protein
MKRSFLIVSAILGSAVPAVAQSLTGAGATFPNPIYTKWFDAYNKKTGIQINYQSIGSVFRILLTHMMEDPHTIGSGMELFLSRNLERVADLATNIGEDVVFLVEGRSIKHHAEDRGEARERPAPMGK